MPLNNLTPKGVFFFLAKVVKNTGLRSHYLSLHVKALTLFCAELLL